MYEFGSMPMFDMDYFNSPAFQQAIAAAMEQYSPTPVAPAPVYTPPPVYTPARGIGRGRGGEYDYYEPYDYDVQAAEEIYTPAPAPVYTPAPQVFSGRGRDSEYNYYEPDFNYGMREEAYNPVPDQAAVEAELAAAQAEAQAQAQAAEQAAAQARATELAAAAAEAQRVAAEQEYFARVEAERVAAERAAAAEAAAQRQQTELNERRAQAAQAAAERAAQERAFAEQAAAQAAAEAQAAAQAQAQAAAQAEAQRVAAERAQAEAQAAAQVEAQRVAAEQAQAEQARVQAEQAAAVTPAPEPVAGIGRRGGEDYYQPEFKIPEVYAPQPVYYAPEPEIYRGIGDGLERNFYDADRRYPAEDIYIPAVEPVTIEAEPVRASAVEPMTIEAEPVAGIGSPAVAAAEAPSLIETAAAPPAAGGPLTQEQYDAMADRRAAANTLPQGTYIAAPTGGRGEDTGFETPGQQSNSFQYRGGPVRVVDGKGNVLFSGEGPEGAVAAARFAQNLSDTKGSDATWDLQEGERTINPDGSVGPIRYVSGPSTRAKGMGTIGDLAAFVLPIAAAIAAGPLGLAAQVAMGAAAGGLGAVMSGNDPLKAALIAGASAGIMNVSGANQAISGTLDKIGGAIAGEALEEGAKKAGEKLAEQIVVTGLSRAAQGAGSAIGNTLLSEGVKAGIGDITGYQTPAEKFAEQPLPETLPPPVQPPVDEIVVTAAPRPDAVADVISGIGSSAAADVIPSFETPADRFVQETPIETPIETPVDTPVETPAEDTIVVTGTRPTPAVDAVTRAITGIGNAAAADVINQPAAAEPSKTAEEIEEEKSGEIVSLGKKATPVNVAVPDIGTPGVVDSVTGDIVVSKPKPEPEPVTKEEDLPEGSVVATLPLTGLPTPDPALTDPKSTLDKIIDAAEVAGNVIPIVGGVIGGGGGGGGTIAPDTSKINFTKTTLRPTIPVGGIGGTGSRYPYTPQTYGRRGGDQEAEYLFFTRDPVTGQELLQSAPMTITTPVANEPAGPAMIAPSDNTFAEGGEVNDDMVKHLIEYHKNGGHQGPGQVKGIGSGQDDKIPAWLSDGEYVWSAQDVADLGDGSTDEGVRRLDKMRQMVRRQAGRKDVKKIAKPQKGIDTMLKAVGGLV